MVVRCDRSYGYRTSKSYSGGMANLGLIQLVVNISYTKQIVAHIVHFVRDAFNSFCKECN